MNNFVFGKTMENVQKYKDIKLVEAERRRHYLVSEPNFHTRKFFSKNLLAIEMKKTQVIMNRPAYLRLPILDINKTKIYEFWYDYLKPKCNDKAKLHYMDADSFIAHKRTEDIYKDISEDVETRFDTSNYNVNRLLSMGKKLNST